MKIRFVAIKKFETNEEAIALAEKVKAFINGGWVHEFEPSIVEKGVTDGAGTFETGTELFTKLWEVQNTHQGGDRVFVINNCLEEEDGWLLDVAWARCGRYGTDRGFNQDSGTITIAIGDDINPFVQVDVVAECSRNSLREHVLRNLLEVCGFTQEDWDGFDVDKQSMESDAPEDMKWYERRGDYIARKYLEGKTSYLYNYIRENHEEIDILNDGPFSPTLGAFIYSIKDKVEPHQGKALMDEIERLVRDICAYERAIDNAFRTFKDVLDNK